MGEERKDRDHLTGEKLGIYLHIPFCQSKCLYCAFPSYPGQQHYFHSYALAVSGEIEDWRDAPAEARRADTVYIGGGTPSLFPEEDLELILNALRKNFFIDEEAELTIEGNPESLSREKLTRYRALGINRISIGFQSLHDDILKMIGRVHASGQAIRCFRLAREAGFENISIDLIAGLPGHTPEALSEDLGRVADLRPEHISVYLLEAEKDVPLVRLVKEGRISLPEEETMALLYTETRRLLLASGYHHYEISNFALSGRSSRHNRKYWTDSPYLGFGSSAHSYINGERSSNVCDVAEYVSLIGMKGNAISEREPFDPEKRLSEALFMGMRLTEGADISRLGRKYGVNVRRKYQKEIEALRSDDLLEWEGKRLRLTERGLLFSNEVFSRFV